MAEENSFDRRIVERNIKRNKVTRKDYDQYLNSLDDVSKKAIPMYGEEVKDSESSEGEKA